MNPGADFQQVFSQFFCGRKPENNKLAMLPERISNIEHGISNDEVSSSAI
jgi:hypothetical protein